MPCRSGFQIGLLGASYFLGWCSTLLILPPIADRNGRKKIFFIGMCLNMVVMIFIMASTNYWFTIASIFAGGMLSSIRQSIGYTYFLELIPMEKRTRYSTIWSCSEAAVSLWSVIYFTLISRHWFWLIFFGFLLNTASVVCIW